MAAGGPRLEIEPGLLEEAADLALRGDLSDPYWAKRERLYSIEDPEERERGFAALARRAFESLGLAAPILQALAEHSSLSQGLQRVHVGRTVRAREEGAELFVGEGGARTAVVRVRAQTLLDPRRALAFLRHEIFHVADMLDPAFGYDPAPPSREGGPGAARKVLDRYRVLWDAAIDGRLAARGHGTPGTLEQRRRQFAEAFPELREKAAEAFESWWAEPSARHADILALARGREWPLVCLSPSHADPGHSYPSEYAIPYQDEASREPAGLVRRKVAVGGRKSSGEKPAKSG
ncbi:MAG: hypothetical protein HY721_14925 [Planctomycetes bacterium]|nr:hypothetical protein [Planctomycetota bacterium]